MSGLYFNKILERIQHQFTCEPETILGHGFLSKFSILMQLETDQTRRIIATMYNNGCVLFQYTHIHIGALLLDFKYFDRQIGSSQSA